MRPRRRSKAEWAAICADFAASGETAAAYARRRRLNRGTMLSWHYRLKKECRAQPSECEFVEVVAEGVPSGPTAVVRVGKVVVEFGDGPPPAEWIAELASRC